MLVCSLCKWCSQIIAGEGISKNLFQNTGFIFGRLVGCVGFFLLCCWCWTRARGWLALEHRLLGCSEGCLVPAGVRGQRQGGCLAGRSRTRARCTDHTRGFPLVLHRQLQFLTSTLVVPRWEWGVEGARILMAFCSESLNSCRLKLLHNFYITVKHFHYKEDSRNIILLKSKNIS